MDRQEFFDYGRAAIDYGLQVMTDIGRLTIVANTWGSAYMSYAAIETIFENKSATEPATLGIGAIMLASMTTALCVGVRWLDGWHQELRAYWQRPARSLVADWRG